MSSYPQKHRTRSQIIRSATAESIASGRTTLIEFAYRVVDTYFEITHEADIDSWAIKHLHRITDADSHSRQEKNLRQVFDRLINGGVQHFPSCIEDAWILSLPAEDRWKVELEIGLKRGYLAIRRPSVDNDMADFAAMLERVGRMAVQMAPILSDKKIDHADLPHLPKAILSVASVVGLGSYFMDRMEDVKQSALSADRRKCAGLRKVA